MATERPPGLLGPDDPAPVRMVNARGRSAFLLTGDHAGQDIPSRLDKLGLADVDVTRHIAVDIGIAELGTALSARLDAAFLWQSYSRLVIDCNRDPRSSEAIPISSDGTAVPGNVKLTDADRTARIDEIHRPYHTAIAAEIAARAARGQKTIVIALHSFTPKLGGIERPWDIGVLYNGGDEAFAKRLLQALAREPALKVGDNQPYHMDDTDFSVPHHAFAQALPYAEIEVRQDLIADAAGQRHWTELLFAALVYAEGAAYAS